MAPENRDEVRQRIDSLYDRAENATGNFNATRAMAARTRSRGVPLAKRRGPSGQDPALDAVARQWFDGARAKLGPTVPAALPADRLPAASAVPERPREGMGGFPGADRESRALTGGDRRELALPGPDREVLALPAGDRAILALPAGGGDSVGLPGGGSDAVGFAGGRGEVRALPAGDRAPETGGPAPLLPDPLSPRAEHAMAALTAGPSTEPAAFPQQATEGARTAVPVTQTVQQPYFADEMPGGSIGWVPDPAWAHSSSYAGAQQLAEPSYAGAQQLAEPLAMQAAQPVQTVQPAQAEQWLQRAWEAPGPTAAAPAMPTAGVQAVATATPVTDTGSFTYPQAPTPVTDTGSYAYPPVSAPLTDLGAATYTPAPLTDTGSLIYPPASAPVVDTGSFAALTDTGSYTAPVPVTAEPLPLPVPVPESPRALRAAKAIAFARAQVGKPCVWGATGPDSYDCSSLTLAAWRAAGVELPRAAHQQALAGDPVTLAGLEPGDLVLFFDDDRHVGLHVGDGMMVHAPGPGSTIREESIYGAGEAAIHRVVRPA
ncbi:NlpC/P60 family protein [Streptomyces sp. NPDC015684]|uniref:C40 family peptidase n=1 Tax=Streptomyces sp. NPDC015684 TaxID=3364963 RepID=UPI0037003CBE